MKWILVVVGSIAVLVAVVAVIGALLPKAHRASRWVVLKKTPREVYAVISDTANAPGWRHDLQKVEDLPPVHGLKCFRETGAHGVITYVVLEDRPGELFVSKIADENLPFGGQWTFEFAPAGAGTRLRLTEEGEVRNVIFRFVARHIFGHAASIEGYLRDLGKKLGEPVEPHA
jgi:Polyketide cyclase / dehydrase and lipid transport